MEHFFTRLDYNHPSRVAAHEGVIHTQQAAITELRRQVADLQGGPPVYTRAPQTQAMAPGIAGGVASLDATQVANPLGLLQGLPDVQAALRASLSVGGRLQAGIAMGEGGPSLFRLKRGLDPCKCAKRALS